ncbi:MAG: zinc-dependent peptidase [Gammaproteobacteria bacterium]|nr:zinc-dependent peptidase [Gammaproteobacteria bacterium]
MPAEMLRAESNLYLGLLLSIGGALIAGWLIYFAVRFRKRQRRRELKSTPLPVERRAILQRNVPVYRRLPPDLQDELQGYVNVFLHDMQFIGCAGLDVTDEMRVTIAGNACLLLLNRHPDRFAGFASILLYPDAFVAPEVEYDGDVVIESDSIRAGESWHAGPIVLSWSDVRQGIEDHVDGHNVVLHEFAHKLDEESGYVDGLPILREEEHYAEWAAVLSREFDALTERVNERRNDVMDAYGADSPPEFFAVATETFFERGDLMRRHLPDLYAQLRRFYGVDPAAWG